MHAWRRRQSFDDTDGDRRQLCSCTSWAEPATVEGGLNRRACRACRPRLAQAVAHLQGGMVLCSTGRRTCFVSSGFAASLRLRLPRAACRIGFAWCCRLCARCPTTSSKLHFACTLINACTPAHSDPRSSHACANACDVDSAACTCHLGHAAASGACRMVVQVQRRSAQHAQRAAQARRRRPGLAAAPRGRPCRAHARA